MNRSRRIIADNKTFSEQYHLLQQGDLICCRLRIRPGEEHLLLDLAERGIEVFPSLRAQLCSRSKCFQTRLFSPAMVPLTTVIYTIHDLSDAAGRYHRAHAGAVVIKTEGKNAGTGIFRVASLEEAYMHSSMGLLPYPYVLQPFVDRASDIRVIIIGDYLEAYTRINPHGFRHNLHCGGHAEACTITIEQEALCRSIMGQGGFPYAHIDLLIDADGKTYFSEINLRGGLRGAQIGTEEYRWRIETIHRERIDRI